MPINLGSWSWAVNMALDFGAPALGAALGVPGPVSTFAVSALKRALGLADSATPAQTEAAANADPEVVKQAIMSAQSEVTAKYQYLTRLAEVGAEVAKANVSEINQTMRVEAAQVSWYHWRHLIGYLVILYGLQQILLIWVAALWPTTITPADVAALFNATTIFTGGLFALLGYVAMDTTNRINTAITGEHSAGGIMNTIRTVAGKKK